MVIHASEEVQLEESSKKNMEIDEVDTFLATQPGKIERKKTMMCRHNDRQKCTNCLPIDPYDEEYMKENNIKHLSFHAYVRKLTDLHGKGTQLKKPLENIHIQVKLDCKNGHLPYPHAICTKCRPPSLTLNRQKFRHVDNITIENKDIVDRFLDFWRRSNHQRIGYLIGRYEPFLDVPLGIKAVVTAIYEPPQHSSESAANLDDDPHENEVDELCRYLGMKRVGWIFTDLWAQDPTAGTVHCIRNEDSFLLSAEECITAGAFQNKYKNYTQYSSDGYFGSKFVTVVATGNKTKQIDFAGYQVSDQCTSMVEADILCPTNHFELASVREHPLNEKHYITDVQFTEKNEYGAEVQRNGKPMPVEFLLVDVPVGMPIEPYMTFNVTRAEKDFPIENRTFIGQFQDVRNVAKYVNEFTNNQFLELISNFHFLLFLVTNDIVRFTNDEIKQLCELVVRKDRVEAADWAEQNPSWQTFKEVIRAGNELEHQEAASGPNRVTWACPHCTFENTGDSTDCAVCNLPRA